jgi:hypothetical protein
MMSQKRFQDQNYRLTHFQEEVAVVCPRCQKKALATVNYEEKAKLTCNHCGCHEVKETLLTHLGHTNHFKAGANQHFDMGPWNKLAVLCLKANPS